MKCGTCGTQLRMERVMKPIYEDKQTLGIADRLRYQTDSHKLDAEDQVEETSEIMCEAADLFDQIQQIAESGPGDLAGWLHQNVFNRSERVQTGSEPVEEPSDCPRCQGAY